MCQPPQNVPLDSQSTPLWNKFKAEACKKLGVADLHAETYNFSIGGNNAQYYNFHGHHNGKAWFAQVIQYLDGKEECSMAEYSR